MHHWDNLDLVPLVSHAVHRPPAFGYKAIPASGADERNEMEYKMETAQNMKLHLLLTTNSILGNLRFRHHLQNMCCPV